ncbi:MAG: DNA polymerase III subunit beta, partial [Elusimicrobiota bacterium]
MYLTVSREKLIKGIQVVETAVSSRATLPVLSNIIVEVEQVKSPQKMKLVSTDLEIAVKCYVECEVKEAGAITVPAKKFSGIIKEITQDNVQLKTENETKMDIKAGKSHFILAGTPKDDFPVLPDFVEEKSIKVDSTVFLEMIKKTLFAVSSDETRYALTGIYSLLESNQVKLVATDGRRLAYVYREVPTGKTDAKAIIPGKTMNELLRILSMEEKSEVEISLTENQASFRINGITLISRLIDSKFANYEQIIPKKSTYSIKVNNKNLTSAMRQISFVTMEKGGTVKYSFNKDVLRISAQSKDIASGEVDLDLDYKGPSVEVAFNPVYILDFLKSISEEEVMFEINTPIDA